jgi:hypothetical protein
MLAPLRGVAAVVRRLPGKKELRSSLEKIWTFPFVEYRRISFGARDFCMVWSQCSMIRGEYSSVSQNFNKNMA